VANFNLDSIRKIFSGSEVSKSELAELNKEVMFMTLARATSADTNIKNVEVERVQEVLKARTGDDFSAADIRVAAQSAIFESAPLVRYLNAAAKKLSVADRVSVIHALTDVIESDGHTSDFEVAFFNDVAAALQLTPAQLVGLNA
jgi:uncharacterized tellurite resistance protein B-like protein